MRVFAGGVLGSIMGAALASGYDVTGRAGFTIVLGTAAAAGILAALSKRHT